MSRLTLLFLLIWIFTATEVFSADTQLEKSCRSSLNLSGVWEIRPDKDNRGIEGKWFDPVAAGDWRDIVVPASWETVLGRDYDGVAWYRTRFVVPLIRESERIILHYRAVATETRIWINGTSIGSHEGPWTPFYFDITNQVKPGEEATLIMRVDEKVGHNTQGFLPIIAPHFAGIWQDVEIVISPENWLDNDRLIVRSTVLDAPTEQVELNVEIPLGSKSALPDGAELTVSILDKEGSILGSGPAKDENGKIVWNWQGKAHLWNLGRPNLYTLRVEIRDRKEQCLDRIEKRFGFRTAEGHGDQLRVNGEPVTIRGFLTWGYYPPLLAPNPDPELFREQLRYFRDSGFNLIKFCLWLPPRRLLDIVDEEGMLAWVEYPTWHPQIDQAHCEPLLREYTEMSAHDLTHPSVILRSITCETGPSSDLEVIRALYNLLKDRCPGTLVLDDSSWIGWNRIHDFWDDHSYGNNRTWRETLRSLDTYRREREMMPLVMGEAIAADTWVDSRLMLNHSTDARQWWMPRWLNALLPFERNLQARFGIAGFSPVPDLRATSLKYAMDMRRWQMETFREELPWSGYVVSTVHDARLCAMGLLDYLDNPKWSRAEWGWNGDWVTPLKTSEDQRGFALVGGKGTLSVEPCLRYAGPSDTIQSVESVWTLRKSDGPPLGQREWKIGEESRSSLNSLNGPNLSFDLSAVGSNPEKLTLERDLKVRTAEGEKSFKADWEFWAVPDQDTIPRGTLLYGDCAALKPLFPEAKECPAGTKIPGKTPLVVTSALDLHTLAYLRQGGHVLHFTSDQKGSLKADGTWFLRGTTWAPPCPADFFKQFPREMLAYLQLFELGGDSVIRGEALFDQVDPLLLFPETHDLETVRPNLLMFASNAGKGRLAVSCLRHTGGRDRNFAGYALARYLANWLVSTQEVKRSLNEETLLALETALTAEIVKVEDAWRFSKDPQNEGKKWTSPDFDDSKWAEIVPRSEEEQTLWNAYDGWGCYRKRIQLPAAWNGKRVRIVFDSVDDQYELYVNGQKAGGYGKSDKSETAFLKRTWVDITGMIKPGEENLFTLRVNDWVGSGGLNGAIWITTGPVEDNLDLLRK